MLTQEQKDNVMKLITALRSGRYRQGYSALCVDVFDDEGTPTGEYIYCCLGVAGRVLGKSEADMKNIHTDFGGISRGGFLSEEDGMKFGFEPQQQKDLARMNDNHRSFNEIADYLDEFLRSNS